MAAREVVVLSGVRTAIGDYGAGLKDVPPTDLASACVREALARADVDPQSVQHTVFGNVIHTESKDMYLARVAAVNAGVPVEAPALTLNRLCGSGLQAVVSAAQMVLLGDADTVVAGGAESMSRSGYWVPGLRWGSRMGDAKIIDAMTGALTDPFGHGHMGCTAENVAQRYGLTREEQDRFAVESHQRAVHAIDEGRFKSQIVPIEIPTRKGPITVDTDEHPRRDASVEGMAKLRAVFQKDGSVTAGNASGINDGAAAVTLMEAAEAQRRGATPIARLVAYGHAGVEPGVMGIGPVPAVQQAMKRAGLNVADMDVIESNEAFAAQAMAVARDLDFPSERTNPNGGAVALGHPVGATGCILLVKALHELARVQGRYALVTMCIGGGQGIAAIFERL